MANDNGWILFAADWFGLGRLDLLYIVGIIFSDIPRFPAIPESIMQSQINQILLMRMMKTNGKFAQEDCFKVGGVSILDTNQKHGSAVGYYGNSLGGVSFFIESFLDNNYYDIGRRICCVIYRYY
jgi:hypothetical protein